MDINSVDLIVRIVPRYGFLPLVVANDRAEGKTIEVYRGEFQSSAIEAHQACVKGWEERRDEFDPHGRFQV